MLKISVIITGVFAFIIGSFLVSMFLGSVSDTISSTTDTPTDKITKTIHDTLKEWSNKFEIAGVCTLMIVISGLLPIPLTYKGSAILLELLGGAIAWFIV